MMFNGKRIAELEERLAKLESQHASHVSDVVMCRNFHVYKEEHKHLSGIYFMDRYERRAHQLPEGEG